jgi:hypothetical protein
VRRALSPHPNRFNKTERKGVSDEIQSSNFAAGADRNEADRTTDMTVASRSADVHIDTGRDGGVGRPNLGADRNVDIEVPDADVKTNQD